MTRTEAELLRAQIIADRNTIKQASRYADQVRWLMTATADRDCPSENLRIGAGPRLSESRRWHAWTAAQDEDLSIVYLTFGSRLENGPSQAFVILDRAQGSRRHVCDFWLRDDGQLQLVSRDGHRTTFHLHGGRLVQTETVEAEQFVAGRKRAKALLRGLKVERPGILRDQHFFEDCTILRMCGDVENITVEGLMQVFGAAVHSRA